MLLIACSPSRQARQSNRRSASPNRHDPSAINTAIIVRNLPTRTGDATLKDILYNKFARSAKVARVTISAGESSSADRRYATVTFRQ